MPDSISPPWWLPRVPLRTELRQKRTRELLELSQTKGEMVAEGIVVLEDGVLVRRVGDKTYMVEIRVLDVTGSEMM